MVAAINGLQNNSYSTETLKKPIDQQRQHGTLNSLVVLGEKTQGRVSESGNMRCNGLKAPSLAVKPPEPHPPSNVLSLLQALGGKILSTIRNSPMLSISVTLALACSIKLAQAAVEASEGDTTEVCLSCPPGEFDEAGLIRPYFDGPPLYLKPRDEATYECLANHLGQFAVNASQAATRITGWLMESGLTENQTLKAFTQLLNPQNEHGLYRQGPMATAIANTPASKYFGPSISPDISNIVEAMCAMFKCVSDITIACGYYINRECNPLYGYGGLSHRLPELCLGDLGLEPDRFS